MMIVPGSLGRLGAIASAIAQWLPGGLFTTGVNGAWYDPSDINLTWRRNLLTYSEQFDNAVWTKAAAAITSTTVVDPISGSTAETLAITSGGRVVQAVSGATANTNYTLSVWVKKSISGGATAVRLTTNNTVAYDTGSSQKFTLTNDWVRISATGAITSGTAINCLIGSLDVTGNVDTDCIGNIDIWGAQLELGSTVTPYQRITDGIKDYLDYNPLPILYQDASGTTPVTAVGQPVGLMLDKSKGLVLGPELVVPGNTIALNANGTIVVSGSSITATCTTSGTYGIRLSNVLEANSNYRISVTVISNSAPRTVYADTGAATISVSTATGSKTAIQFSGVGLNFNIYIPSAIAGESFTISNISVRKLPGNHAYNPSGNSANFPVLSARYNLLMKTEDFSDAVWNKTAGVTIDSTKYQAPDDTLTATRITFASASLLCSQSVSAVVTGRQYTSRVWIKGTAGQTIDISTAGTDEVVTLTGGWQFYTGTKNFTTTGAIIISTYGGATAREVLVWHPDVRAANDALNQPDYQRVNTATDYDTVGFKPYLSFNGVNQWLQTNSIDFTYGDKVFVSAGVRKLSDAATGVVTEVSNSFGNVGIFDIFAPVAAGSATYTLGSGGTFSVALTSPAAYASPATNIISGIGNISAPSAILRVNGSQVAQSTSSQGTGNYGNYPMYIGARAGASLFFNGRLYGLVVAGKQASTSEIASTEAWLNQKTGAY